MSGITGDQLTERLASRLKKRHATQPIKYKDIEDFCGISHVTSGRWLRGHKIMGGSVAIKLWYFLALLGVKSPEMKSIQEFNPYGAYIGELFGYGVVNTNDVLSAFGFPLKDYQSKLIIRHMRGETNHFDKKPSLSLEQLHELYDADLKKKKEYWLERLGLGTSATPTTTTPSPRPDATSKEVDIQPSADPVLPSEAKEVGQDAEDSPETEPVEEVRDDASQMADVFTSSSKPKAAVIPILVQQPEPEAPVRHELVCSIAEKLMASTATAVFADRHLTPEERSLLREMMTGALPALSTAVDRLTSERARRQIGGSDA